MIWEKKQLDKKHRVHTYSYSYLMRALILQFLGNEAHFTSLINYQAYSENAPEVMTLVHYTDVAESKEIVLMVGEFDGNSLVS